MPTQGPPKLLIALRKFVLAVDKDVSPNSLGRNEGLAGLELIKEIENIIDARVNALPKKGNYNINPTTLLPKSPQTYTLVEADTSPEAVAVAVLDVQIPPGTGFPYRALPVETLFGEVPGK